MRQLILIFLILLFSLSCQQGQTEAPGGELKRYDLRGKILAVDKAKKKAEVDHEEIPGFMPRMTMTFPIKGDWLWEDLKPGVDIRAELVVDNTADEPYWLEKVVIVAAANPDAPLPEVKEPEQIGQEPPPVSLTDQDGKRISFKDYQGKALALTFIYRECPLADYCIKMSRQFSDLALQINENAELRDKIRLLSISFDPERDTPAKLREYGVGYLGNPEKPDFTVWRLAVGDDKNVRTLAEFFNLKYEVNEDNKAEINHNLVTAVIAPDGKVAKMLPGNRWTNEELLRELGSTLEK
ncbi:MAG TPA: SCO family protein [Pyrinomonadaceae bacterium]|nr:SCO family protein [Pyrinomonadaceae bacterium]HMP65848.1 SCO family protein [Pyrinomonadaceae bacterium]